MSIREIIVDIETTGLDFKGGDKIIEIACVELINHVETENYLQFYCSTNKIISEEAKKVHGLSNDFLNQFPTFANQVQKFLTFIKNDLLIIHNAEFDLGFINHELQQIGLNILQNESLDTVGLARKKLKTRLANLDYLCRRFSIDLSSRKLHGALLDCRLLSEVYIELLGGRQTTLELTKQSQNKVDAKEKKINTRIKTHLIQISLDEQEKHKEFVKGLKNNIWSKAVY